jgi:hypothetical protein
LNFAPGKTFPQAKVDFAQPRTNVESRSEVFDKGLGSLSGTTQVARIDSANCVLRQHGHQPIEPLTALLIELRIRMAAEPARHIGFGVTK